MSISKAKSKTSMSPQTIATESPPTTYITKSATLRLQYTNDHYVAFSCFTHDLKSCWLILPAKDASTPSKITSGIYNYDLYHLDAPSLNFQAEQAAKATVARKGIIAISNGWLDDRYDIFIYSDRVFRAPVKISDGESAVEEPLVVACPDFDTGRSSNVAGSGTLPADMLAARKSRGTVKGWKKDVARPALCSSPMMAIAAAVFAAPLLAPMDIDPYVAYLAGRTSGGKTSSKLLAASAIGIGKKELLPTWRNTESGLEQQAHQEYADMAFPIDELSHVGSEADVFKKIDAIAYMFDAGVNKKMHDRASSAISRRPRRVTGSRAIVITSYEWSLAELEAMVGTRFRPGVRVRVMELPMSVCQGAEGIFDRLPKYAGQGKARTKFANTLTKKIRRACAKNSGKVFVAYLKMLLADLDTAKTFVRLRMDWFMEHTAFDHSEAEEYRQIEHFAFLYGSGAYAIELGLLPWTRKQLLEAIRACYRASRASLAAAAPKLAAAPADLMATPEVRLHQYFSDAQRVVRWPKKRGGVAKNGPQIDGWRLQEAGQTVYRIKASAIQRWFPTPEVRKAVLTETKAGCRSSQVRVPGCDDRVNVYIFRIPNRVI